MKQRPRLFVQSQLAQNMPVSLTDEQHHYLRHVLRLSQGDVIEVFNGRDGGYLATLEEINKKSLHLVTQTKIREQDHLEDVWYLFAPLKQARQDYMAQKATEMGVSVLQPVVTAYTQVRQLNEDRLRANSIEAAEQCNLLCVPEVRPLISLGDLLVNWPKDRMIIFCDEKQEPKLNHAALQKLVNKPCAVLIGPEGGFSENEASLLRGLPFVLSISLGVRVLRADTAAVAALAMLQLARS